MFDRKIYVELTTDCSRFHLRPVCRYAGRDQWFADEPEYLKSLPDFKRLSHGEYECGVVDTACETLLEKNAEFSDDAALAFRQAMLLSEASRQVAKINADYKLNKTITVLPGLDYGRLVPYQQVALTCTEYLPGFGLFMKQGTGKTPVAITAICAASKKVDRPYRAIVVVPPNVLSNWEHELQEFNTLPIASAIIRGAPLKRLTQMIELVKSGAKTQVMICGYETLQGSHDHLQAIPFDMAILDEAQYIKSKATKRWKYVAQLRDRVDKRLVLTGTPIANSIMDLYTLFEFIGEGMSGFRSFEGFKKAYSIHDKTEHGDKFAEAQNIPSLQDRLSRCSFVITKEEAMPYLPPKVFDIIDVEMTPAQSAAYALLRDQLVLEIDADLANSENEAVTVQNVLVKLLRLSQITAGFKVISEQHDEMGELLNPRTVIPFPTNPKLDAVMEVLLAHPKNEKAIIWSNWIENITDLHKMLAEAGHRSVTFYGKTKFDDRKEAERLFNFDKDMRFFIGNAAAGGTGLNLLGYPPNRDDLDYDTNATLVGYISQDWSPIKREQSEDRAHRRGTRKTVRVIDFIVPNTIDTIIANRVTDKRTNAISVLDLRAILTEIKI